MKPLVLSLLLGCIALLSATKATAELSVCASTSVVRHLVSGVLPPDIVTSTVMADDTDPHTFEPRPSDIQQLQDCELIVLHGAGLESWSNSLAPELQSKVIRLFPDQRAASPVARPHAWLSPKRLASGVPELIERTCLRLPDRCPEIRSRGAVVQGKLQELSGRVASAVATWRVKNFVSLHPTWRVFAEDYGLTECGVLQDTHAHETTPRAIQSLTKRVRAAGEVLFIADAGVASARYEWFAKDLHLKVVVLPHQPRQGEEYDTFIEGIIESWGKRARE